MYMGINRNLVIGIAMLVSAASAAVLTPKANQNSDLRQVKLPQLFPEKFLDWKVDGTVVPLKIDPRLERMLEATYSETLSRTYVNSLGERIMLSVAYGGSQSKNLQVHRPEVCYSAQGFEVKEKKADIVDLRGVRLPVTRLIAKQDRRIEPITYWIRVGNEVARDRFDQMFARYKYGLIGKIPDGVLIRVSSLTDSDVAGYESQDKFIQDIFSAMTASGRSFLFGGS